MEVDEDVKPSDDVLVKTNNDDDQSPKIQKSENSQEVCKKPTVKRQFLLPLEPVPSSSDYTFVMANDEGLLDILNSTDPPSS